MSSLDSNTVYIDHTGKVHNLSTEEGSINVKQDDGAEVSLEEGNILITLLDKIIKQQKLTNLYLEQIVCEKLEVEE